MNNGIILYEFERDYRLSDAYDRYEKLEAAFIKHYRRTPNCGIFVGTQGERDNQKSLVTVRWTDTDGENDARGFYRFVTTGQF